MLIVCRGCKRSGRIDRRHVTCHKYGSDKFRNQQYYFPPPHTLRSLRRSLPCYRRQSNSYLTQILFREQTNTIKYFNIIRKISTHNSRIHVSKFLHWNIWQLFYSILFLRPFPFFILKPVTWFAFCLPGLCKDGFYTANF